MQVGIQNKNKIASSAVNIQRCNENNYICFMRAILPPGMAIKPVQIQFTTTRPITDEKKAEILKWCDAMKQKYPRMKAQRIANKAVKYFNL